MHPSSGITKEYSVTLDRKPRQEDLEKIAAGEQALGRDWGLAWVGGKWAVRVGRHAADELSRQISWRRLALALV